MITTDVILKSLNEVGLTVLYVLIGTALLEVLLYFLLVRWLRWRYAMPVMLLTPAIIGLFALVVYPLLWEANLSLTNMSLRRFKTPEYIGFQNYVRVIT